MYVIPFFFAGMKFETRAKSVSDTIFAHQAAAAHAVLICFGSLTEFNTLWRGQAWLEASR